jgi:hypothetical protein
MASFVMEVQWLTNNKTYFRSVHIGKSRRWLPSGIPSRGAPSATNFSIGLQIFLRSQI